MFNCFFFFPPPPSSDEPPDDQLQHLHKGFPEMPARSPLGTLPCIFMTPPSVFLLSRTYGDVNRRDLAHTFHGPPSFLSGFSHLAHPTTCPPSSSVLCSTVDPVSPAGTPPQGAFQSAVTGTARADPPREDICSRTLPATLINTPPRSLESPPHFLAPSFTQE